MEEIKRFIREEDAIGVVEIILILVILIGLVLIFKNQITSIVEKAFKTITKDSKDIIG
ncbi:Flp1 family type IVb pilin [Anaerolentibacter hominis]|uniref:Flp1 family type IVb pilin n=1 Tax=Anaerolentibacter hominis TaxID=3079009 RepID=UPI0031B838B8